jgi:3'-phosphoadenosine 5'-phosphosulfate sulfotransferase (PAPS reductase)/FAD synthetase
MLWEYIKRNDITLPTAYTEEGYLNTGCNACSFGMKFALQKDRHSLKEKMQIPLKD